MSLYIKVGSITNAQRARRALQQAGIKSYLQRLQNPMPGDGCGYVVVVNQTAENALVILENNGIRILGVESR